MSRAKPIVRLSEREQSLVEEEGRRRDDIHPHSRNWNMKRERTNVEGLKGELAFAKFYGLDPDLDLRTEGDGGYDFEIELGGDVRTVDVKTSTYTDSPHLLVRAARETHPDLYVLAAADLPEVELLGMMPADMVLSRDPVEWPYDHANHRFKAGELLSLPPREEISDARAAGDAEYSVPTE